MGDFQDDPPISAYDDMFPAPLEIAKPKLALNGRTVADKILIDKKSPLDNALLMVERKYLRDELRTLHHQQQVFSRWENTHYRDLHIEEVRRLIYSFLESALVRDSKGIAIPFNPSAQAVNNILDALRAACQLDATIRQPAWLDGTQKAADEFISCRNGLLHLESGELIPHTPAFYANCALEYDYNPHAPTPHQWLAFLKSLWGSNDAEEIGTLQEMFGYLLGTSTALQKILLIVGPKRSGKGTIARVLSRTVGSDAIVSPTLVSLLGPFGLQPLIGKRVATITDARLAGRGDQASIAERLLSISGEDMQTIERKYLGTWTGRLPTRFLILTNELPSIPDSSGALASRFLVLTMTKSFFGAEDHDLTNKLITELPGILNWAIDGWRNLKERGRFQQPQSSQDAIQELEDLGSPISAFIRECCIVESGHYTDTHVMFREWSEWCAAQGRDHIGTSATLGKMIKSAEPGVKTKQYDDDSGKKRRRYEGIRISQ